MKKTFKKFLSSALAAVMTAACLTVGMASTVSAATATDYTEYGSVQLTAANVKEWGFTTSMPTGSNKSLSAGDTVNGITFTTIASTNLNKSGYLSAGAGTVFTVPVPANSTGTIYVQATSGNAERYVSFTDGTAADGTDVVKKLVMNTSTTDNSAVFTAAATSSGVITLTAAGGECKIGLIRVTLDDGFSFGTVTTYTWTLDTTGLVNVDGTGLALGKAETTSLTNTLTYSGEGYTLKKDFATVSNTTEGVTVTDTAITVKPTDDWFDVVVPRTYSAVEPTVSGNTTTYDFTKIAEGYLVSVNDTTKSATTAYTDFAVKDGATVTDNECYVTLSSSGAKLYDDSDVSSTKMVIPFSVASGKVTVSGEVTPTNNTGSKWNLVDFGCAAVMTDANSAATGTQTSKSTDVVFATDSSTDYEDNAGAIKKNQTIKYNIVFDLDANTATAEITNGSTSKTFTDVALKEDGIKNITFVTNQSGTVTGGKDRALLIPSVTVTTEASEGVAALTKTTAYTAPAVVVDGNNFYAIAVIDGDKIANAAKAAINTSKASEVDTTDTVYQSVKIGENTYTAAQLFDSAKDTDKVFATCIANDNAADAATVLAKVLTLVVDVQ